LKITSEQIIIGVVVIVGGLFAYGYYEGLTSSFGGDSSSSSSGDSNTTFGILVGLFAGVGALGLGALFAL
jgi:hypothetical protein